MTKNWMKNWEIGQKEELEKCKAGRKELWLKKRLGEATSMILTLDDQAIKAGKAKLATPSGSKTGDMANPPDFPQKRYVSYHLPK